MGRVLKAIRELQHGWNAFDQPPDPGAGAGPSMPFRAGTRSPARYFNDRSIIASIFTRISVDASQVEFMHCRLNADGIAAEIVPDSLHERLTLDSNIDQYAQFLKQDAVWTLLNEGVMAIVPTETSLDPAVSTSYNIGSMRVASIKTWFPRRVTVEVYDDRETDSTGQPINGGIRKNITLPKEQVVIVENPFYNIMNEPSGTLQRLIAKLSILDSVDEAAGSGKLDMIFQLPYAVRGENRTKQAEKRRDELLAQLKNDELGIGYIDVSEKVIQLNRPIENKLLAQIEYLYKQLYAELGLTQEIMSGTATQDQINNYYDRTIEPIVNAIAQEMKRKFLTKTARTQGHSIEIYRDPLKLIPIAELAEVADKLVRNGILSANEFRPKIGFRPSKQPGANDLSNPQLKAKDQPGADPEAPPEEVDNGSGSTVLDFIPRAGGQ